MPDASAALVEDRSAELMPDIERLKGLRLLVVEDEAIVAMLVEDMLTDLGCVVVDIAGTVRSGLAIVQSEHIDIDGAVLDLNLGGEKVFPVAEALATRGLPFLFATGYGMAGLDGRFADRQVLAKPFQERALIDALLTTFITQGGTS